MKLTSGSINSISANEIFNIPVTSQNPSDPYNNLYPGVINASGFASCVTRGRNTPGGSFSTYLKNSWFKGAVSGTVTFAQFMNTITGANGTLTTNKDTASFGVLMQDGNSSSYWHDKIFDAASFAGVSLYSSGAGGGIGMDFSFIATTGSGSTTFGTSYATDYGTLVDGAGIDFGGSATASSVESWRLTLVRGQAFEMFFNPGSYDPASISSGMFGGTLEIVQSPNAATVPSSAFTVRLYPTAADQVAGTNLIGTIATKINLDVPTYNRSAGLGRVARMYTLIDTGSGGTPCAFS